MSFIQHFKEQYGDTVAQQISTHLGIPAETAASIAPKLLPALLGGLARQAQEKGPESVEETLRQHGDPAVLDNLPEFMSERAASTSNPLADLATMLGGAAPGIQDLLSGKGPLGGILGGSIKEIAGKTLGSKLGIDKDQALMVIPMVVPVILGALSRAKAEHGLDQILAMLDQDGDTTIIDGMLSKFGGGGGGGGLPGGLGNLFGGKS